MSDNSIISEERSRNQKRSRVNPIRGLDPARLGQVLDSFDAGDFREAAWLWEAMERRDPLLRSVTAKRKKAPARRQWEILTLEDTPAAAAHKAVLEEFYNNLTASHAVEKNQRGGFSHLVRFALDAVGKKYACFHVNWKPSPAGLSANLEFVPLWFFEGRTGELRFLESDYALDGQPLEEGQWVVFCGDGLMEASSVAYVYKHLSLKDWVIYCERHGMPGIVGKSSSSPDSPGWEKMREAVELIASNFSCVTSVNEVIEKLDLSQSGQLPYPQMVDAMDRAQAILWRGADLSTISSGSGDGTGASVQGSETDLLEADDCALLSETLSTQLDPLVIAYTFGRGVRPLAYIQIPCPERRNTKQDIEVDTFLRDSGVPLGQGDTLARYGRPAVEAGELVLRGPGAGAGAGAAAAAAAAAGNARRGGVRGAGRGAGRGADLGAAPDAETMSAAVAALREDLDPVRRRLASLLKISDPAELRAAADELDRELPLLLTSVEDPALAAVIEGVLASGFAAGLETAPGEVSPTAPAPSAAKSANP